MQEFMEILDNDGDAAPIVNTPVKKQPEQSKNVSLQQKTNQI